MAEKEGFEPSIPFWGIHDFQSCALGQLRDFSMRSVLADLDILQHTPSFVKSKIHFFPAIRHQSFFTEKIIDFLPRKRYNDEAI